MSITLPTQTTGGVLPEYAAQGTTTSRIIQKVNGVMVARFTANINYTRTDFLVDEAGNRVAVIQPDTPAMMPGQPHDDTRMGNVYVSAEAFEAALAADPDLAAAFEKVAAYEDGLIRADLVKRGII